MKNLQLKNLEGEFIEELKKFDTVVASVKQSSPHARNSASYYGI